MGTQIQSRNLFLPSTDDDRRIIREELERLLASPQFRNSKRYPSFLRHVVEEALAGRGAQIKERSLAIDVFDRPSGYDSNSDHIVRSTAAEIRKRLAQFYEESDSPSQVRIDLPPGTYVPEFRMLLPGDLPTPVKPIEFPAEPNRRDRWFLPAIAALGIAAVAIFFAYRSKPPSDEQMLADFWEPVLSSSGAVTFCMSWPWAPAPPANTVPAAEPPSFVLLHKSEQEHVSVGDADAVARMASFLGSRHRNFRIGLAPSLSDLRQGPLVLIGGLNNQWTKRLTANLRFMFEKEPSTVPGVVSRKFRVRDSLHLENHDWTFDYNKPASEIVDDYALVTRMWDSTIGRHLIAVAGVAKYGTVAASEFLTDPLRFAELARHTSPGWNKKNVQVVIRTRVIGDSSGSPEVLAVNTW